MSSTASPSRLPNPILLAAQASEPALLTALLSYQLTPVPDIHERDELGLDALSHLAQIPTREEAAHAATHRLLAMGANPDQIVPDIRRPPVWNSTTGQRENPKAHLACVAIRYSQRFSPLFSALGPERLRALSEQHPLLHEALSSGRDWAVEALLAAGADPNREDPSLGLPASQACHPRHLAALINAGARLSLPNSKGVTALQSISSSPRSAEILALATQSAVAENEGRKAKLREPSESGRISRIKAPASVLDPLIKSLFQAVRSKNRDLISTLWKTIGKPSLLNARDESGRTLLHAAIETRNLSLARKLFDLGFDVNAFDHQGVPPSVLFMTMDSYRIERDRNGSRRLALGQDIARQIRWHELDSMGRGYFEALYNARIENKCGITPEEAKLSMSAPGFDWLFVAPDGSFPLLRVLRGAQERLSGAQQGTLGAHAPLASLLNEQAASDRITPAMAQSLLRALFAADGAWRWTWRNGNYDQFLTQAAPALDRLMSLTSPDPDFKIREEIARVFPELHSKLESWSLRPSSTVEALASSAPRRRL